MADYEVRVTFEVFDAPSPAIAAAKVRNALARLIGDHYKRAVLASFPGAADPVALDAPEFIAGLYCVESARPAYWNERD